MIYQIWEIGKKNCIETIIIDLVYLKKYGFEVGQFIVRIYTWKIEQKNRKLKTFYREFYILFVMHSQFNE